MHIKINRPLCALIFLVCGGIISGVVNGVFGTGGGIIAVFTLSHLPFFKNCFEKKDIFAMTLFICFLMSLSSAFLYVRRGLASISSALPYVLPAIAGGTAGAFALDKIKTGVLSKIFAFLTIYAGVSLIFR